MTDIKVEDVPGGHIVCMVSTGGGSYSVYGEYGGGGGSYSVYGE